MSQGNHRIDEHGERLTRVEEGVGYLRKAVDSIQDTQSSIAENIQQLSRVAIRQEADREKIHALEKEASQAQSERDTIRAQFQALRSEFETHREWIKSRWWMLTSLAAVLIIFVNLLFRIFGQ